MEFFNQAKAVRLKSFHDRYLAADKDGETVRQSRDGSSGGARWTVEYIQGDNHHIRLKSCYGKYLTASEEPFMLGMAGKKVIQDMPASGKDIAIDWEPRTEGFLVKLRTRRGKFLRANERMPPWNNSVTHGISHRTVTQDWLLWEVEVMGILENNLLDYISPAPSSFGTQLHGASRRSDTGSQMSAMDIFEKAKSVRLRSHHDKYLTADNDEESVSQERNGTINNAKWTVEIVGHSNVIRLKSCFGKYLTASNLPFFLGMTGKKVLQTLPERLDSSVEWEPIREGVQVRLRTRYGQYLRANGGVPPWRNHITHDIPLRTSTQDWILWGVDVVQIRSVPDPAPPPLQLQQQPSDQSETAPNSEPGSPTSPKLTSQEPDDSFRGSAVKNEGRVIHYRVAMNVDGNVDENEELSFTFKGCMVEELKNRLEEETGLTDIQVCSRNPLNGKFYPLRLHLPPNNTEMHVVVVPSASGRG
ncbi:hypothetical protein SADUNF_Sadunf17G0071600 [Salix dunnii]|uniref:DUF569 domain-containing protein n=1 Tax=Salix dunnii TaxID=1413687 RepID=A0A835J300_9ROSI|nr:hypothetical protein SADUNF_Sadunf17G0071600 [Salix dunnii]